MTPRIPVEPTTPRRRPLKLAEPAFMREVQPAAELQPRALLALSLLFIGAAVVLGVALWIW